MRKVLITLLSILIISISFWFGKTVGKQEGIAIAKPTPIACTYPAINRDGILIAINEYRIKNNLPTLRSYEWWDKYAQLRAGEIAKDFLHKTDLGYIWEWQKNNVPVDKQFKLKENAEVLARGLATSCEVVQAWDRSPTHKEILLDPKYNGVGIGVRGQFVAVTLVTYEQ